MEEPNALDTRLLGLLEKGGDDVIKGVVEEVSSLGREVAALRRELSALTAYQGSRDRWLEIKRAELKIARLPRVVVIEADQMIPFQDGFYQIEYAGDGTPFRWTGPGTHFSFDVFIDRSKPADLKLEALSSIDYEAQKDIALLVDGEPVPATIDPSGSGFNVAAILPPREGKEGTNLVFALPTTLVPPESEDKRALGVAFARLTVMTSSAAQTQAGERAPSSDVAGVDGGPEAGAEVVL